MLKLPTFTDFFKSYYYSNTYVPPVDLSDKALSKHLLERENSDLASTISKLISEPEVRTVLSEPLSYEPKECSVKNEILQRHNFKLLNSKLDLTTMKKFPFYSVVEHDDIPEWVIKSGARRIPKDQFIMGPLTDKGEMAFFANEESIMRIEMVNRIAKVAFEANIDVILPKKKLVAYSNLNGITEATRKYCVVCEKIDILSAEETVDAIKNMDAESQTELARKIVTLVKKAGFVDASFDNIRLTPHGELAIIDTEPAGLMVAKKPGIWNKIFAQKGASVEKCARIGLFALMYAISSHEILNMQYQFKAVPGLEPFHKQVEAEYKSVLTPKISKWKIALGVASLGLISLVNAISAFVNYFLTCFTARLIMGLEKSYDTNSKAVSFLTFDKSTHTFVNLQSCRAFSVPFIKFIFARTEGVPAL